MTSDENVPPRVELLNEAAELIDGDRNVSYGSPTQNFSNIAEMWTTRFRHKLKDGEKFDASDVADAMILLKVARNIASKKRDNYTDLAGYAGCGWEAVLEEQRPKVPKPRVSPSPPFFGEIHIQNCSDPHAVARALQESFDRRDRRLQ